MSYVALYRKFRPQTFDQVRGQDPVVRALKNQLINGRIGHSYLFAGTRGTGKTSAARIFARAVNCLHPQDGEPCNECENCRAINAGNFVDVIEVDAASNNGVDDIRRLIEDVRYTPVKGSYKVFIIDEAHMITGPAFNAFLKTLEEPPAYAVFILATTEPHKLPVTILSRCQRYDFRRITREQIVDNLFEIVGQEGIEAEQKALDYIARIGDGSMRDSISLLDKCIAFSLGGKLTYDSVLETLGTVDTEVFSRLFRSVYAGDVPAALNTIDEAASQGRDLTQFATDLIWYIRNILMVQAADLKDPDILGISTENLKQLSEDARIAEGSVLIRYIRILSELLNQIRFSFSKQVLLEVAVIRLARPEMETDPGSLADRIRHLEDAIRSGGTQHIPQPVQMPMQPQPVSPDAQSDGAVQNIQNWQAQVPVLQNGRNQMNNPDALAGLMDEPPIGYGISQQADPETLLMAAGNPAASPATGTVRSAQQPATGQGTDLMAAWSGVADAYPNPRIRSTLHKCRVSQADGRILILAPNEFSLKQLKDETVLSQLKSRISQAAGREIEIQTALSGNEPEQPGKQDQFPEELLNKIHFNIGTEEQ